ncbi:MAG: efflux RND transporter periplasmic adaptor subunit [Aureliella sp.]
MTEVRRSDRLRNILRRRGIRRRWEAVVALIFVLIAIVVPVSVVPRAVRWWQARRDTAEAALRPPAPPPAIIFPAQEGQPLTIDVARWDEIGLKLATIEPAPEPPALQMDGVLYLDPDDFSLVRSRFQGEVVEMSPASSSSSSDSATQSQSPHTLRFGDKVSKGQLLAVVWSRELGEKKSELAQTLSTLAFDRETLSRLSNNEAAVPINSIREAQRRVRESEIAAERIEKTLRSWQLSQFEIERIRSELSMERTSSSAGDTQLGNQSIDRWARVEVRSPIDGTIVEKNVTEGALVDLDDALFKIANLDHLDIRAFAYEEDLAALQQLTLEQRRWTIRIKGDINSTPIHGVFDRIGSLIDPLQHTGLVMGWVGNSDGSLRPGQFVTAAVVLPDPKPLLCLPAESIVDVNGRTYVLWQQTDEKQFLPIEVHVVRFQDSIACIKPRAACMTNTHSGAGDELRLELGEKVVCRGATEVMAEVQMHQKSSFPTNSKDKPAGTKAADEPGAETIAQGESL